MSNKDSGGIVRIYCARFVYFHLSIFLDTLYPQLNVLYDIIAQINSYISPKCLFL